MKYWLTLMVMISLVACASHQSTNSPSSDPAAGENSKKADESAGQSVKSPQGYVVKGPKGRFGGFEGDCSSDENFQHYWKCQAENAGNGGFN